jgi:hypothetical protein
VRKFLSKKIEPMQGFAIILIASLMINLYLYLTNAKFEKFIIENMISQLKIYEAFDEEGKEIKMIRMGNKNDGGYVVPVIALEKSEVLIGYGIANDAGFEEAYSRMFNKPSYGFDCTMSNVITTNKLFTLIDQCIETDSTIYGGKSSGKISSFSQHILDLNLAQKPIFLKLDIEAAEFLAFNDIYAHSEYITGIAIEIHMWGIKEVIDASKLLSNLANDFILIHIHANNAAQPETHGEFFSAQNIEGSIPRLMELTFINKKLANSYVLSNDQSFPKALDMPINTKNKDISFKIKQINHVSK